MVVVPSSQTELRLRELELPAEGHTAGDQPKPVSCPTPGCFSATAATWGDSVVVIILAHIGHFQSLKLKYVKYVKLGF